MDIEHRIPSGEQDEAVSKMVDALAATFIKPALSEQTVNGVPSEEASGTNTPLEPATPPSSAVKDIESASAETFASPTKVELSRTSGRPKKSYQDFKSKHPEFNTRKGAGSILSIEEDPLRGGSQVALVPQAIQAIIQLRKIRDEEEEFSRFRDMDRPPMPPQIDVYQGKPKPKNGNITPTEEKTDGKGIEEGNNGNKPYMPRRGVKSMSNKEREALAEEVRSDELIKLQEENPEYYVASDEKGRYCNVCGTPLVPDPKVEQLSIWLHAIRYCKPIPLSPQTPILIDCADWTFNLL